MFRTTLFAVAASIALAGCSAVGALNRASEPLDVYDIRAPKSLAVARGRPQGIDFIIEEPTASGVLNTDRIVVRPSSAQVQYLPDARWSETAPSMIRSALIESFERTGAFRYVGRSPLALSGDVALVTNLSEFHAEILPDEDAGTVRMTLVARLVREDNATILTSRTFTRVAALPDVATPTIIAAYESAAHEILSDLAEWVLESRGIAFGSS
ncbi:ABC-type transport auxiliary lipoprotein family protein [Aliiruegeria sabulilitoris]|uniref:ABC-type transport auxiliary lipoprotein family protein n=1 Tax=Aliiruegeria sabulilitoris TaxID=1510458 RepID=UPI00082D778E|nr:ABC-type transport auxiliary lipoprotein family protein [Aliiruegeria sabulilitoris]